MKFLGKAGCVYLAFNSCISSSSSVLVYMLHVTRKHFAFFFVMDHFFLTFAVKNLKAWLD
jgi:hypothetical protein